MNSHGFQIAEDSTSLRVKKKWIYFTRDSDRSDYKRMNICLYGIFEDLYSINVYNKKQELLFLERKKTFMLITRSLNILNEDVDSVICSFFKNKKKYLKLTEMGFGFRYGFQVPEQMR